MEDVVSIVINNANLDYFDMKNLGCTNRMMKTIVDRHIKKNFDINTRLYACIYHNLVNILPQTFESAGVNSDDDVGIRVILKGKRIYCYTSLTSLSILEDDVIPEDNVHVLASTYKHMIHCGLIKRKDKSVKLCYGNKHMVKSVDLCEMDGLREEVSSMFTRDMSNLKEVQIYYYNINKNLLYKLIEEIVRLFKDHISTFSLNIQQENCVDNIMIDDT
jgi:hypothetical protein